MNAEKNYFAFGRWQFFQGWSVKYRMAGLGILLRSQYYSFFHCWCQWVTNHVLL